MALGLADRPAVKFSDLQREPREISRAVDTGPIKVTRRDGDPLILVREDEFDAAKRGMALASQVMGFWLSRDERDPADRLSDLFPWTVFLLESERPEFARELLDTARACASTENYLPLLAAVKGWQSTAEAYAAGWGGDHYEWLDQPLEVPRPE